MNSFFLILVVALSMPSVALASLTSVTFGGLHLQLQSNQAQEDAQDFLVEVLTETVEYLDNAFYNYFVKAGMGEDYFSHVGLSVDTFDINSVGDRNFASVGFSGTAFFKTTAPSADDITTLLLDSFQGTNSQMFTTKLMQSDSPFLQQLSYAVVQVNGQVLTGNVVATAPTAASNDVDVEKIALIAGATGAGLLVLLLCYCFCCGGKADEPSEAYEPPQKKPTMDTSEESQTQDIEKNYTHSPGSPQSITSQDSSVFTYNPPSRASFDASTLSTNTNEISTNSVDLSLWQKKHTITNSRFAPFGHDISAIEMLNENKKDLSLIEEGEETNTPQKSRDYLSKSHLSKHERRDRSRSRDVSYVSESSEHIDVLADLRNLSQQINQHRRR